MAVMPALSSAPRTVFPAERTTPSATTGSTPRQGSTQSMCAQKAMASPGPVAGTRTMTLPQSPPKKEPASSTWMS